jgi:hypothetical protein
MLATVGFIKQGFASGHRTLCLNPIGTDANFPSKLAGGKAGLKMPKAQGRSFPINSEVFFFLGNGGAVFHGCCSPAIRYSSDRKNRRLPLLSGLVNSGLFSKHQSK